MSLNVVTYKIDWVIKKEEKEKRVTYLIISLTKINKLIIDIYSLKNKEFKC